MFTLDGADSKNIKPHSFSTTISLSMTLLIIPTLTPLGYSKRKLEDLDSGSAPRDNKRPRYATDKSIARWLSRIESFSTRFTTAPPRLATQS